MTGWNVEDVERQLLATLTYRDEDGNARALIMPDSMMLVGWADATEQRKLWEALCTLVTPPRIRVTNPDGTPEDIVARTASGKVLTEADIERLAAEAAEGYDVSRLSPKVRSRSVGEKQTYQAGFLAGLAWRHENLPLGLDAEVPEDG